ncbi:MAG: MarR family transcriptional regulator [Gammaproteobacteria bacterium]|nr:MarR family transcriptional regulator [Gammaproteobacteria bacterium]
MDAGDFRDNAGYLIHEADRLMSRQFDRRMRALGLTRAQWWVLAQLYFNDGVTQSELAGELGFSKAALGGLLDRLESKGWLERRPHGSDRRAKCVHRSRQVGALLGRMRRVALAMTTDMLAGLNDRERTELMRLLRVVVGNLDASEQHHAGSRRAAARRNRAA